jgi:hypothetical protein
MIRRYDEVISTKASKLELDKIFLELKKVPRWEQFNEQNAKTEIHFKENHAEMTKVQETMRTLNENIAKDIFSAVRRAT